MPSTEEKKRFQELFERFGDTPINDDGEIDEPFEDFPVGTPREEVWYWFEDEFDWVCIAEYVNGDRGFADVAYCPKDIKHEEFSATAHVTETWKMDRYGNWIEAWDGDGETIHSPDSADVWTCLTCGARAEFTDNKTFEKMLLKEGKCKE